jgi:hypothetical protein
MLSGTAARASDNSKLSESLAELTHLIGSSSTRKWTADSAYAPPRLRDAMILTGMELSNDGENDRDGAATSTSSGTAVGPATTTLWRLTVPPMNQTASSLVSPTGSDGSLQVNGLSLGGPNGTAQRGKGCVLVFPGPAEIVTGQASQTVGVWIHQTSATAGPPFTRCTDDGTGTASSSGAMWEL